MPLFGAAASKSQIKDDSYSEQESKAQLLRVQRSNFKLIFQVNHNRRNGLKLCIFELISFKAMIIKKIYLGKLLFKLKVRPLNA